MIYSSKILITSVVFNMNSYSVVIHVIVVLSVYNHIGDGKF